MKILVTEDEAELATSISSYLQSESYVCEVAATFKMLFQRTAFYTWHGYTACIGGIDIFIQRMDDVACCVVCICYGHHRLCPWIIYYRYSRERKQLYRYHRLLASS